MEKKAINFMFSLVLLFFFLVPSIQAQTLEELTPEQREALEVFLQGKGVLTPEAVKSRDKAVILLRCRATRPLKLFFLEGKWLVGFEESF